MTDDAESGESQSSDEEVPRVLIASLGDLGPHLADSLKKTFGKLPIWFIREDGEELVELFDHLPEDPMPKGRAHELLRALRAFSEANSDRLQELLGMSEGLVYGFHGDATLTQVKQSFENDGFFVWEGILRGGNIV